MTETLVVSQITREVSKAGFGTLKGVVVQVSSSRVWMKTTCSKHKAVELAFEKPPCFGKAASLNIAIA